MIKFSLPNKVSVLSAGATNDINAWLWIMTTKQDKFAGFYASNAIEDWDGFLTAPFALGMRRLI